MSRRDLIIYILIAAFTLGGGALISGLTVPNSSVTPYLIWGGVTTVLLAGVGLVVMLFTAAPVAPSTAAGAQPRPPRQPLSDNAAQVLIVVVMGGGFLGFMTLLALGNSAAKPTEKGSPAHVIPPIARGPVTLAALRDPKVLATDLTPLIGKQEDASGVIVDETAERSGQRYTLTLTTPSMAPQAYLVFDQSMYDYQPGDRIYARCRIERADAQALGLSGCKVITTEEWTSPARR